MPRGLNVTVPADVTRDTANFVKRILGPLAEIGNLFSEKVRFLRWKSAAKTLNRAAEIVKEMGISPREIPIKFLVPFIEDASLEEEESLLIEQWASLLASASEGFASLHVAIKDVLKNISSKEAMLIERLGATIDSKLFEDKVSSYQIIYHINVNIRSVIEHYSRDFEVAMSDTDMDILFNELVKALVRGAKMWARLHFSLAPARLGTIPGECAAASQPFRA
jgi:hypothetical protein